MSSKRAKHSSPMYTVRKHGGKQKNATPSKSTDDFEVIDSSILDCPICFELLRLPLFQCINGHVVCSECSTKLMGKCPTCSTTTTSRCIPFESLIRSIKTKCAFAEFGCAISLQHDQIATHENKCMYAPCTCPIPGCNFKCRWFILSSHVRKEHASYEQQKEFNYDQWFSVRVEKEKPYVLRKFACVYVLLNHRVDLGYAFWIVHVGERMPQRYELKVDSVDGNALALKGWTKTVRNFDEEALPEFFMYLPSNLLTSTGHLNFKIKMSSVEGTCD